MRTVSPTRDAVWLFINLEDCCLISRHVDYGGVA